MPWGRLDYDTDDVDDCTFYYRYCIKCWQRFIIWSDRPRTYLCRPCKRESSINLYKENEHE